MSVTKILFKQGTSAPSGQDFTGTNGEPLWDSYHKKLYVSNGTTSPTLIGPIQADWNAAAGSPGEILNKPNLDSFDTNDNIEILDSSLCVTTVHSTFTNFYSIGLNSTSTKHTQYVLDLRDNETFPNGPGEYGVIDLGRIFSSIGTANKKKVTLFITNMSASSAWNSTGKFPLFWFSSGGEECSLGPSSSYRYRLWKNSKLVFDTKVAGEAVNLTSYTVNNVMNNSTLRDLFYNANANITRFCMDNGSVPGTVKLEIVPTALGNHAMTIDIYIISPGNISVVNSLITPGANATEIATIDGVSIYSPTSGNFTLTGINGCKVTSTSASALNVMAELIDYNPIGVVGDYSSTEDANITAISLTDDYLNNGNKLCVKETSAFGDAFAEFDGYDTIEWTLSETSRSYCTVDLSDMSSGTGTIALAVTNIDTACQSDHYIYIFNGSNHTTAISANDFYSSEYGITGIPSDTVLLPNHGVEVSMALKRYSGNMMNTAVMTASEPLRASN